ncbi:MAG: hypothetical protein ACE360_18205, partial [Hyphomicrobiales bacterium]
MKPRTLLVKPPDPFLQAEFVYQQLAPHYLESWLAAHGYPATLVVMYIAPDAHGGRAEPRTLADCHMIVVEDGAVVTDGPFDSAIFDDIDLLALSVMTPQAEYAGWLTAAARNARPGIKVMM